MEYRTPNDNKNSDWHCACAATEDLPFTDKDVKHMHACVWGENDGPDWIWIVELNDGTFGYLMAGCDYTGWGCKDWGWWHGGHNSAIEAAEAVDDERKVDLIAQIKGEKLYAAI